MSRVSRSAIIVAATTDELIKAVREGNIEAARALLKQRVDVNAPQGDGATALHWAVQLDDLNTAEFLLRAGARADAANDTGVTPLYLACMNRNAVMVEKLLAAGANPNAALLKGETVLMMCARSGNAVSGEGAAGPWRRRERDRSRQHSQTALMWAVAQRRPEVVKVLLEAGANVRARSRAYPQIVTGEETQRAGREELNYTVFRGGSTPLLFAARSGDVESARLLLAAGADANEALPDGASALIVAAHSGNGAVGALLLEHGADPNAAAIGYTPLHAAVLRGDLDSRESAAEARRESQSPDHQGHAIPARERAPVRTARTVGRRDAIRAGRPVPRDRDHAHARRRRRRHASAESGRDDAVDAGGGDVVIAVGRPAKSSGA